MRILHRWLRGLLTSLRVEGYKYDRKTYMRAWTSALKQIIMNDSFQERISKSYVVPARHWRFFLLERPCSKKVNKAHDKTYRAMSPRKDVDSQHNFPPKKRRHILTTCQDSCNRPMLLSIPLNAARHATSDKSVLLSYPSASKFNNYRFVKVASWSTDVHNGGEIGLYPDIPHVLSHVSYS